MILSPKLFIDACVARPISNKVLTHYQNVYPSMRIDHLTDRFRQGRCDSVWIKTLASEGGWIIVTADRGAEKNKPSLPRLCREYQITCVAMTDKLAQKGAAMHMEVLHEILRNAEPIYRAPAGTVLSICQTQQKGGLVSFALRINRPKMQPISLGAFLESMESAKPKPEFTGNLFVDEILQPKKPN